MKSVFVWLYLSGKDSAWNPFGMTKSISVCVWEGLFFSWEEKKSPPHNFSTIGWRYRWLGFTRPKWESFILILELINTRKGCSSTTREIIQSDGHQQQANGICQSYRTRVRASIITVKLTENDLIPWNKVTKNHRYQDTSNKVLAIQSRSNSMKADTTFSLPS